MNHIAHSTTDSGLWQQNLEKGWKCSPPAVPNLLGNRDWFHGRGTGDAG